MLIYKQNTMLNRKYRASKKEIEKAVRIGKKVNFDGFYLKNFYDDELKNTKFAVVVPKKVNKLATVRNSIKRKFRAAALALIANSELKSNTINVFIVVDDRFKDLKSTEILDLLNAK